MDLYISTHAVDSVCLKEIRVDGSKIHHPNYQTFLRNRRTTISAGAVAIMLHKHLQAREIQLNLINLETVTRRLVNGVHIISAYLPPSANFLINDVKRYLNLSSTSLLVGDLNAKHLAWNNPVNNRNSIKLFKYISSSNIELSHPDDPTYLPSLSTLNVALHNFPLNSEIKTVADLNLLNHPSW